MRAVQPAASSHITPPPTNTRTNPHSSHHQTPPACRCSMSSPSASVTPPPHTLTSPCPSHATADAVGLPVFDVIALGVGPDGHVASLFPNRPELAVTDRWVLPVTASPKPPAERITMSLPVINAGKEVRAFGVLLRRRGGVLVPLVNRACVALHLAAAPARAALCSTPANHTRSYIHTHMRPCPPPPGAGHCAGRGQGGDRAALARGAGARSAVSPDKAGLDPALRRRGASTRLVGPRADRKAHPLPLPPPPPVQVQSLPGALPAQLVRPSGGRARWVLDAAAAQELNVGEWEGGKGFPRNK